jgi:hypothetical protein
MVYYFFFNKLKQKFLVSKNLKKNNLKFLEREKILHFETKLQTCVLAPSQKEILTKVTNARAGISNAKNPEDMELMGKEINTAINLAFEAYPQIRSTENFGALQAQLEGTENRINKARTDYNETIKKYNSHIRGFFNSMFLNKWTPSTTS